MRSYLPAKHLINLRLSQTHTDVFARFVGSCRINDNLQLHKFLVAAMAQRSRANFKRIQDVIIDRCINPSSRAKSERQAGERCVKIFAFANVVHNFSVLLSRRCRRYFGKNGII